MTIRAFTMLNENGDTTISWTEDLDDQMEAIIQKKMDEGCTFFIIADRGVRSKLSEAADIRKHRALAIPDEDLQKFVEMGVAIAGPTPAEPVRQSRVSRSAKEVAKSQSVGVKQRRGG